MEIQSVEDRPDASSRRLTGVRKRTFHEMVFVLYTAEVCRKERGEAESSGRGNTAPDDVGILARIPHISPYRLELRGQREHRLQQHPLVRGYAHQEQGVHTSRQERPAPQRPAVRERPHRRDRNARGATSKKQRRHYSGKKKRHTLKAQLVVEKTTGTIICVAHAAGRRQDFRLFKQSRVRLHPDTGYMGLQKLHGRTTMPKKCSKKNPLNKDDQQHNRTISQDRVPAEQVIGVMKRFKIVSDRYGNHRKRFGLRFTLIAAVYNKDLTQ